MSEPLPSLHDINVYDSLDERSAVEHFLGKDLDQAEALFRENFLYYQEDLMWMGPAAFCYYVDATIKYLLSPAARGGSDDVNCFCGVLESQLEFNSEAIAPARGRLHHAVQAILNDFERYGCDPRFYGELRSRYRIMQEQLAAR